MKKLTVSALVVVLTLGLCFSALAMEKKEYPVKRGDTPSDILWVLWLFHKITLEQVISWNPEMGLHNIYPGQKIIYYVEEPALKQVENRLDKFESALLQFGASQLTEEFIKELVDQGKEQAAAQIKQFRVDLKKMFDELAELNQSEIKSFSEIWQKNSQELKQEIGLLAKGGLELEKEVKSLARQNQSLTESQARLETALEGVKAGQLTEEFIEQAIQKNSRQTAEELSLLKSQFKEIVNIWINWIDLDQKRNNKLLAAWQKDRQELKQSIESIARQNQRQANFYLWIVLAAVIFLTLATLVGLYLIRPNKKEKEKVELTIKGQKYCYYPKIDKDGHYISLHQNENGDLLAFSEITDLRKSLAASFNRYPELIQQEIKAGRLKKIK